MKITPLFNQHSFKSHKPPKYEIKSVYGENYQCDNIEEVAKLINQPISNIYELAGYGEISGYRIQISPIFKKEAPKKKEDRFGVYVVNTDGDIKKYETLKIACSELDLDYEKIVDLTTRKNPVGYGYGFLRAKDIEYNDSKGNLQLREEAINQAIKSVKDQIIYAVDKEGNYQKFNSIAEASQKLDIKPSLLGSCIKNPDKHTQKGMCFFPASKVEYKNEAGEFQLDAMKLIEYSKELFRKNSIYVLSKKTGLQKFDNIQQALQQLNLEKNANIVNCLQGTQKQSNGYSFFKADLIESKNSKGEYTISKKALAVIDSILEDKDRKIHCITPSGRIRYFRNEFQAAHILNMNIEEIFNSIESKTRTSNGFLLKCKNEDTNN